MGMWSRGFYALDYPFPWIYEVIPINREENQFGFHYATQQVGKTFIIGTPSLSSMMGKHKDVST